MSGAIKKLDVVKGVNPVTEINQKVEYVVFRGGQKLIYRPYKSNNSNNNSNWIFQVRPPSNTIINRHMKIRVSINIVFAGTGSGSQNLLQTGYDAFRQFPLASITNSLSASINGTSVDIQLFDLIHAMSWYFAEDEFRYGSSTLSPGMPDQSQQYDDLSNSIRNPLNGYWDSIPGGQCPRGSFPMQIVSNTNTGAEINAVITEDIYVSPFLFQSDYQERGFYNVETLDLNWNLLTDLSRIWSHNPAGGSNITGYTITLSGAELLINQIEQLATQPRPAIVQYNYDNYLRHITDSNAVINAGASASLTSGDISAGVIPSSLYIYVKRQPNDESAETADAFFQINKVTLLFNNDNTLLATATQQQLYEISHKNGLRMSWQQFKGDEMYQLNGSDNTEISGPGSVIKLNFGDDIPLELLDAVGMNKKCQIQVTVDVKNLSSDNIAPRLMVVQVNNGVFSITSQRTAYTQVGVVLQSDLLNIDQATNYISASELGRSKSMARAYLKPRKMMSFSKELLERARGDRPLAKLEGSGGDLIGGMKRGRRGGDLISSAELQNRMDYY
jgi:hypothetical protein